MGWITKCFLDKHRWGVVGGKGGGSWEKPQNGLPGLPALERVGNPCHLDWSRTGCRRGKQGERTSIAIRIGKVLPHTTGR